MCKCGAEFASSADTRIIVQTPTVTEDAYGGRSEVWLDASPVWAVVEPMAGREIYVSAQLQSRVDARITIRYQSGLADTTVASTRRVKVGSRLYNVKAIRNLADDLKREGRSFQQLLCVEGEPS